MANVITERADTGGSVLAVVNQAILILSLTGCLFGLTVHLMSHEVLIWFLGLMGAVFFWVVLYRLIVPWLLVWFLEAWRSIFGP